MLLAFLNPYFACYYLPFKICLPLWRLIWGRWGRWRLRDCSFWPPPKRTDLDLLWTFIWTWSTTHCSPQWVQMTLGSGPGTFTSWWGPGWCQRFFCYCCWSWCFPIVSTTTKIKLGGKKEKNWKQTNKTKQKKKNSGKFLIQKIWSKSRETCKKSTYLKRK